MTTSVYLNRATGTLFQNSGQEQIIYQQPKPALMNLRMSPAPYVQQTKLAMNPTIFSIVIFFRNDRKKLLSETFVVYANCNDISEMFEELLDKSDLVRVASFMRKVMSKFKYESTHPKENAPKKPKTIKYTRSGRAIRPPTTLTFWFPYIATFYT